VESGLNFSVEIYLQVPKQWIKGQNWTETLTTYSDFHLNFIVFYYCLGHGESQIINIHSDKLVILYETP